MKGQISIETAPKQHECALLKPGERLDDLERGGLMLIQHPKRYRFGMDSVLLAAFAQLRGGERVLDLGTGTGVLPMLIAGRYPGVSVTALEIQPELADMARRSARYNGLDGRVTVLEGDLVNAEPAQYGKFDAIVCNPPYKKRESGLLSATDSLSAARYELYCTLEDIVRVSAALLNHGGKLFIMQRAERLVELVGLLSAYRIPPKLLRLVHPKPGANANLALVCALNGASPAFTTVLPPLTIYDENGNETPELRAIYGKDRGNE